VEAVAAKADSSQQSALAGMRTQLSTAKNDAVRKYMDVYLAKGVDAGTRQGVETMLAGLGETILAGVGQALHSADTSVRASALKVMDAIMGATVSVYGNAYSARIGMNDNIILFKPSGSAMGIGDVAQIHRDTGLVETPTQVLSQEKSKAYIKSVVGFIDEAIARDINAAAVPTLQTVKAELQKFLPVEFKYGPIESMNVQTTARTGKTWTTQVSNNVLSVTYLAAGKPVTIKMDLVTGTLTQTKNTATGTKDIVVKPEETLKYTNLIGVMVNQVSTQQSKEKVTTNKTALQGVVDYLRNIKI